MRLPPLTLVIGGAASGKSAYAEALVRQSGLEKTYVATAQAFDAEMEQKIARHRTDRATHGWDTIEAPLHLGPALAGLGPERAVLVDCITLWLSNKMLAEVDWAAALDQLCTDLAAAPGPVVLVSNEVGAGIVPETSLGRRFRNAQGKVNQRLAAQADQVVQVTVGLPQILKAAPENQGQSGA